MNLLLLGGGRGRQEESWSLGQTDQEHQDENKLHAHKPTPLGQVGNILFHFYKAADDCTRQTKLNQEEITLINNPWTWTPIAFCKNFQTEEFGLQRGGNCR